MKYFFSFILVLLLLPVAAQAEDMSPPELPVLLSGDVTIDGEPAPSGTTVTASVNDEVRGELTTLQDGSYGTDKQLKVSGSTGDEGKTITFSVNGNEAEETAVWNAGAVYELNLSVQTSTASDDSSQTDSDSGGSVSTSSSPGGGVPTQEEPKEDTGDTEFSIAGSISVRTDERTSLEGTVLDGNPPESDKLDRITYRFFSLNTTNSTAANMTFTVSKSWIDANRIDAETISLYHYQDDWQQLDTSLVNETAESLTYRSRTPGFSVFAIAGDKKAIQDTEPTCPPNRTKAYDPDSLECVQYPTECDVPDGWVVLAEDESCPVRTEVVNQTQDTNESANTPLTGMSVRENLPAFSWVGGALIVLILASAGYIVGRGRRRPKKSHIIRK